MSLCYFNQGQLGRWNAPEVKIAFDSQLGVSQLFLFLIFHDENPGGSDSPFLKWGFSPAGCSSTVSPPHDPPKEGADLKISRGPVSLSIVDVSGFFPEREATSTIAWGPR